MKPWKRILLNLFLPGLISGFGMGTAIAIGGFFNEKRIEARDIVFLPAGLLFIAAYAIIFSIIPAAVSTAAMEILYRARKINPASSLALKVSALLGLLSGVGIVVGSSLFGSGSSSTDLLPVAAALATIGTVTGLLTGLTVKFFELSTQADRPRLRRQALIIIGVFVVSMGGAFIWNLTSPSMQNRANVLTKTLISHPDDTASWLKLQAMASQTEYWERQYGLVAIGQVGAYQPKLRPAAIPILVNALHGVLDQPTTREVVLGIKSMGTPAVEAAWPPLTGILKKALQKGADYHGETDVAIFTTEALGLDRDPDLIEKTLPLLTQTLARPIIPDLTRKGDEGPSLRIEAVSALQNIAEHTNPALRGQIIIVLESRKSSADPRLKKKLQYALDTIPQAPIR